MPLLYHAYVYLEFLILACTIYILAPAALKQDCPLNSNFRLQSILRAGPYAFKAQNTFRTILSLSRRVRYVYIHGTYTFAPAARYALARIAFYPEQGKITHWFQEYGDRTYVFAKSPVVLEKECQSDTNSIIQQVSYNERPKHDPFHIAHMRQKEGYHKDQ